MLFLAGSVVFSTLLTVGFKICQRLRIDTFQSIIFNYLTCIIVGTVFGNSHPFYREVSANSWFPFALVLGCCFILFFNITALTVKTSGVAVAGVATKISLVIPFLFSIYYFNEIAGITKWAGISIAIVSVLLTGYVRQTGVGKGGGKMLWLLPFILFLGTGFQDTLIKFTEHNFVKPGQLDAFLVVCFIVAFSIGFILMLGALAVQRIKFDPKAIMAGICIGIPNYLSIWCLVKVLKIYPDESSFVIPVNNVAILLLNVLAGFFLFREKLSRLNIAGILLAIISILLITSNIP